MKYIRTKDAIFKVTSKAGNIYCVTNQNNDFIIANERAVEKQAGTIEELLDCCIMTDSKRHLPVNHLTYSYYKELAELEKLDKDWVVYGAIWTDKGLQFVARMNSKGEFELL